MKQEKEKNWIYKRTKTNNYRFALGTKGKNTLMCIGVNPSTAVPNNLDKTLTRVEMLAKKNKYDSWLMVNLYPQRATDPDAMELKANTKMCEMNYEIIEKMIVKYHIKTIWLAWGNLINERGYLKECMKRIAKIIKKHKCQCIVFGDLTQKGNPRHPLYAGIEAKSRRFNLDKYLC